MTRLVSLPDPFVAELQQIPGVAELLSDFTLCPECERCERSVVYLTPDEQANARDLGLKLYGQDAATRLNRQGCKCPFYTPATGMCGAYAARPLICNLFPLDVLAREEDGSHWWVVFGACEEVARGRLRDRLPELKALASEIDRRMPAALKAALVADAAGAVYEPEFYRFPIHYLMPLGGGFRIQDSGLRTQDSGLRTQDSGLRTQDR